MWDGYVDRAEAALDELSRTIDVVIRIPNPFEGGRNLSGLTEVSAQVSPPLLVGQFADVEIEGSEGIFVSLPRRAVRDGNEVWVMEDGLVRIVPVRVLQQGAGRAYLGGGLEPGATVILDGVNLVTEGMEVRVAGEGGP